METLQKSLSKTAQGLRFPENHRLLYTTTATAAVALLAYSRHCYAEWLALGEGGVPHSLLGWLINVAAHVFLAPYEKETRDTKDKASTTITITTTTTSAAAVAGATTTTTTTIVLPAKEDHLYDPSTRKSHLASPPLPHRPLPRPTVPSTVVPQRQTTATASPAVLAAQNSFLGALAEANPRLLALRPSALESPRFNALWLVPQVSSPSSSSSSSSSSSVDAVDPARAAWLPRGAPGEIVHVHHEGSAHVCLSLVDAADVVRAGWGERHRLSGVRGILPWGYVLLYAPVDEGQGRVWREVVLAGVRVVARSAGFEGEIVVPA